MLRLHVLDRLEEQGDIEPIFCYLTKGSIKDFIISLPNDFKNYDIQRELVSNVYLDSLIDTVIKKGHIPPIVIISNSISIEDKNIELNDFRILDGLQRTYRLNVIWNTYNFLVQEIKSNPEIMDINIRDFSRKYRMQLSKINSSTIIVEKLLNTYKTLYNGDLNRFENDFFSNNQWYEVWVNLTMKEQVEKMLIANAGHKQVSIRHQLELLFLHLLPHLQDIQSKYGSEFRLIREKEMSSIRFSKERKKGWFHFSHIISSMLSFAKGEPLITNANLISNIQSDTENLQLDEYNFNTYSNLLNYNFLSETVKFLVVLDNCLSKDFGDDGVKWIGKEGVLVGMFSSLGKYMITNNLENPQEAFERFLNVIISNGKALNIYEYNKAKAKVDLSKVNIGVKTKRTVEMGINQLLNEEDKKLPINWDCYFRG